MKARDKSQAFMTKTEIIQPGQEFDANVTASESNEQTAPESPEDDLESP